MLQTSPMPHCRVRFGSTQSGKIPAPVRSTWLEEQAMRIFVTALFAALTVVSAAAGEKPVELKKAPGIDRVEANCGACHSFDYIPMNSPFLNAAGWDAEVAKMINAFGAPIDQADARIIADYLKNNYGTMQTTDAGIAGARSSLALDRQAKKASMGGYKREEGGTREKHVPGKHPSLSHSRPPA